MRPLYTPLIWWLSEQYRSTSAASGRPLIHAAAAFALLFAEAALNVTIVAAVSYSWIVRPTPRSRARRRTSAAAAASSAATPTDL